MRPSLRGVLSTLVIAVSAGVVSMPAAAAGQADGCTVAPTIRLGTTVTARIASGGVNRSYRLHVPTDYRQGEPRPVILAFHGRGQTPQSMEKYTGLNALPAIAVYPQGTETGDDQLGWQGAPYSNPAINDVQFTSDVLNQLESQFCVDKQRVYATGKSNGGGFVGVLGCQLSGRIAAIAPVAAAFYDLGDPCLPQRAVPVLDFHGTSDSVIPYNGVASRHLPSIPAWLGQWAQRDECTTGPDTFFTKADVTGQRWSGCAQGSVVEHYRITGGDHTWPDALATSGPGKTTRTVNATQLIWDFFTTHPLP
ncbi:ferulic acid esterase [Kibdelosporangium philippinense]|uniref:Ferulic acid esterase n=1 Tax=Kibdelosporangium philippinense TaxID=211113 RepID=A0ABS8ZRK0_9PSEU|nr:PHB depolymerase family esterase [Kibdelosporangium philippinense]MCE7010277.1 ferulic acid esterase [Kibdelosporangium philippinense]